jgi:two-component system, OmpR family, sensor histidine kinase MtrB
VKGAVATAAGAQAGYRSWLAGPHPALLSGARARLGPFTDRWRRSLQLRVTTATLVLCAIVVAVLGYFLMQQLVTNLYSNEVRSSEIIADQGLATARYNGLFTSLSPPRSAARQAMKNLAGQLASTGGTPYAVVITVSQQYQNSPVFSAGSADGFFSSQPELPGNMVARVRAEQRAALAGTASPSMLRAWASMAVLPSPRLQPGVIFGAPLGRAYQLYYFFPLTAEEHSIASMQRTLLLVGIAVVFLLAGIAWLVTRWVVVPVRLAARGAWRLSTGQLTERMEVRGTDELAALATSFNDMAASLQEKLEELEDLSQVQRQFVSDVSHELRTPLTTIRIASDVLFGAKDEMDQAAARSAELLQSQLERFESLLTDLLEISRYDANAATLEPEPVDVCTIVRQSADVAQQLAERRGTKIEFRLPAEPCVAEVDRRRVERILRNLLLNAVEHGENKDTVVTAAMDSGAVAISVRDFGMGLRPGEDQLVFDRFWRADPARARTSGGTGLGLAIALEDARLHGGWLEAWGEPGRGSVFRLTLPRVADGELHGSPLPLRPDPSHDLGLSASPADLSATLSAADLSPTLSAADLSPAIAADLSPTVSAADLRPAVRSGLDGLLPSDSAGDAIQDTVSEVPAHG